MVGLPEQYLLSPSGKLLFLALSIKEREIDAEKHRAKSGHP
jgi:hypothetical protein